MNPSCAASSAPSEPHTTDATRTAVASWRRTSAANASTSPRRARATSSPSPEAPVAGSIPCSYTAPQPLVPRTPAVVRSGAMFERFTDRARRVDRAGAGGGAPASTTTTSAPSTCSSGLVHEGDGVAAKTLESLGISLDGGPQPGRGDHRARRSGARRPHPVHAAGQEGARALAARGARSSTTTTSVPSTSCWV